MRAVVDLPTATEPATPMTKGVFVSFDMLRKRVRCLKRICDASTWAERSRESER